MIKVTKGNSIVLTNMTFYKTFDSVVSVSNINGNFIAVCKDNGIEVYNKKNKELKYRIPKYYESS